VLALVAASISSGILISRIGYYTPVMLVGVCLMAIGAGLLTTLEIDTPQAKWVGYQFLYGIGMGSTFQAPNLAAQTVLHNRDVPIGTSLMFFSQLLGGAIFISVGQNVLNNQLLERLSGLPGFSPDFIKNSGATSLTQLPPQIRDIVLTAYNESLRKVFQVGLIMACLVVLGAVSLEWRSVKKNKEKIASAKERAAEEGEAKEKKAVETDEDNEKTDVEGEKPKTESAQIGEKETEVAVPETAPAKAVEPEVKNKGHEKETNV
jgi:MFS family permease